MRKLLFAIALCLLAAPLFAADVNLTWNHPGATGYGIFSRDYQNPVYGDVPVWDGSTLSATVSVPDDRYTAFVARAYEWGPYDLEGNRNKVWSGDSNEVVYQPSVTPPEPPGNFIIQAIAAVLRAIVNFFA